VRVGISAYLLHGGADYRAAGVSIYTQSLLRHLVQVCPSHSYIAYVGRRAPEIGGVESRVSPLPTHLPQVRIPWEQIGLPVQARADRLDVLHGTVNVVPLARSLPTVVTVHDLSFLRHPERFPRAKVAYQRAAVALSTRRATRVIAVSHHTRRDLIDLLNVESERISVVYSGVDAAFRPLPDEEVERFRRTVCNGRPYILHVGTLQPRKNLDVLIRAFAAVRERGKSDHVLALVGARGWMYESLFQLVADLGLRSQVLFVDYVPPGELPLWYNGADLFAYPSAYEGFGFPVLEAMSCGLPTITSASSALVELAGDACVTVEPGSVDALAAAVSQVLESEALRRRLREAGIRRAARFGWNRTARQTIAVYDEARGTR